MSETDKVFAGSIPENYDRYMVPLIFEAFAADIAPTSGILFAARRFGNCRGQWRRHSGTDTETFAQR